MIEGGAQMVVKAQNTAQAKKGDEVEIYLSTKAKLKCTAIVYLMPVFGIFLGAFSANTLSDALGISQSLGMVMFTIMGLLLAVFLMRYLANRMVSGQAYTPLIKRVIMRASSMPIVRIQK
jgi:positive regulator of sigma E activity